MFIFRLLPLFLVFLHCTHAAEVPPTYDISITFGMNAVKTCDGYIYWSKSHVFYEKETSLMRVHFNMPIGSFITGVSQFPNSDNFVIIGAADSTWKSFITGGCLEESEARKYNPAAFNYDIPNFVALPNHEVVLHFKVGDRHMLAIYNWTQEGWQPLANRPACINGETSLMLDQFRSASCDLSRNVMSVTLSSPFTATFSQPTPFIRPVILFHSNEYTVDELIAISILKQHSDFTDAIVYRVSGDIYAIPSLHNCQQFKTFCRYSNRSDLIKSDDNEYSCNLAFINVGGLYVIKLFFVDYNTVQTKPADIASVLFSHIGDAVVSKHYESNLDDYVNELKSHYYAVMYKAPLISKDRAAIVDNFKKFCLEPLRCFALGLSTEIADATVNNPQSLSVTSHMTHIYQQVADIVYGITGGLALTATERFNMALDATVNYVQISLDAAIRRHMFKEYLVKFIQGKWKSTQTYHLDNGKVIVLSANVEIDEHLFDPIFDGVYVFVTLSGDYFSRVRCRPKFEGSFETVVEFPQKCIDELDLTRNEFIHSSNFFGLFASQDNAIKAAKRIMKAYRASQRNSLLG